MLRAVRRAQRRRRVRERDAGASARGLITITIFSHYWLIIFAAIILPPPFFSLMLTP
jgi:hypothetical protein